MSIVLRSRKTLAQRYRGVLKKYSTSHLWDFGVAQGPLAYAASHTAAEFIAAHPLWPLWQDAAGTVPACKINDPVGLCKDQYGGAHASQTTTTKRPILSGRVNLLTATEDFASASWTKQAGVTVTANAAADPLGNMTADAVLWGGAGNNTGIYSANMAVSGLATLAVYVRADVAGGTIGIADATITVGETIATLTTSWQRVALTENKISFSSLWVRKKANSPSTIYLWGADLRPANSPTNIPAYQRVTSATDYDTVGFPVRALFDGVDDCLVVPSLDLSMTDKVTVVAGITKLSDAADGCIFGFGNLSGSGVGTLDLSAPGSSMAAKMQFASRGTKTVVPFTASSAYNAPLSAVATAIAQISAPSALLRINGATVSTVATTQGSGNYGSWPLYIGQRTGTTTPFNGAIQSLAVIGNLLPDGEVQILEASANAAMGKVY